MIGRARIAFGLEHQQFGRSAIPSCSKASMLRTSRFKLAVFGARAGTVDALVDGFRAGLKTVSRHYTGSLRLPRVEKRDRSP